MKLATLLFVVASVFSIAACPDQQRPGAAAPTATPSAEPARPKVDLAKNPCFVSCTEQFATNPVLMAPQCENATPLSAYEDCMRDAAKRVAAVCLEKCHLH